MIGNNSGRSIDKVIIIDFDTIACLEGIDAWNDYLAKLVGEEDLLDIQWEAVGVCRLRVQGYLEEI